ncbi:lysin A [Mycobacterium phage Yecey3]|uniref:Lysin A n=1 Tax=Mycobacterium phage Yecey3 TaxID=2656617 RepID=A0A649VA15_9CAUD|nr:endolysin [Mycobacterium phage Yecey3]QGJ88762.1 lysin A [Mycobacterium phage Yecey3]
MVTRANVEATKEFIRARLGNPYVYGGALSENVRQGTDCSEVWQTVLEMVHGRWRQGRQAEGATTESYRPRSMGGPIPDGGVGPFGVVLVDHWSKIPANAAAKICFHHGPGGGANSHMWGELDGMLIESGGSKGLVTGDRAMQINSSYANAWAYLPGPIGGTASLGVGSTGPAVISLQTRLNERGANLEVDGEFGPLTADAVFKFQQNNHVVGDPPGVAGEATLRALGLLGNDGAIPAQPDTLAAEYLAAATGLSVARAKQILPAVVDGLKQSSATNVNRIAMWLAQIGHESAGFDATEEYEKGDGGATERWKYLGRTWIQLTWLSNYLGFSKWAFDRGLVPTPTYFGDNPRELAELKWAGLGAAYYWTVARPDINALSDRRDLDTVTRRINGGTNGLTDRRNRYNRALAVGDNLLRIIATTTEPLDEWDALMADQTRYASRAWFRSDNVANLTPLDLLRNIDGMKYDERVVQAAFRGQVWAINAIAALAQGQGPEGQNPVAVAEAQDIIRQLQAALAAQNGASK